MTAAARQDAVERQLLAGRPTTCLPDTIAAVKLDIEQLQANELAQLLKSHFYDAALCNAVSCLFDAMLFNPITRTETDTPFVRRHMDLLRTIGTGANGIALAGGLTPGGSAPPPPEDLIVKIQIPKAGRQPTIHEYFAGAVGTNQLRPFDAGYAYIFNSFNCGAPGLLNKQVVNYCGPNSQPYDYLIYEKIDGVDWRKMMRTATPVDFNRAFLPLLNSLHIGNTTIGFTHFDLHDANIIMRQLATPLTVRLAVGPLAGMFVAVNSIPTMIDFGFSRVVYKGQYYGVYGFESYGIDPTVCKPMYDVYKLLMFTLWNCNSSNNMVLFEHVRRFLPYFRGDVVTPAMVVAENPTFYAYNQPQATNSVSDFVTWVVNTLPDVVKSVTTPQAHQPLANCNNGTCDYTVDKALSHVGIHTDQPVPPPKTLDDVLDQFKVAKTNPYFYAQLRNELSNDRSRYIQLYQQGLVDAEVKLRVTQSNMQTLGTVSTLPTVDGSASIAQANGLLNDAAAMLTTLQQLVELYGPKYDAQLTMLINAYNQLYQEYSAYASRFKVQRNELSAKAAATGNVATHIAVVNIDSL